MSSSFTQSSISVPVSVAQGGTGVTASTGTIAVVLSTSPTLVTPLLGTPTSGNLANCTGLPVAGGGTGVSTLTDRGVMIGRGTGAVEVTAVGTATHVLTSNGAGNNPTFQAPAGGGGATPQFTVSTVFETATRFASTINGGGTVSFSTNGMRLDTSGTGTSSSTIKITTPHDFNAFGSNNNFSLTGLLLNIEGTDYEQFFGLGNLTVSGTAITFTGSQYGFKIIRTASASRVTSATNANGTTETANVFTLSANVPLPLLHAKKTGTTDIKFYDNRALVATHTTNLPSADLQQFGQFSVTNKTVASNTSFLLASYVYNQDAE